MKRLYRMAIAVVLLLCGVAGWAHAADAPTAFTADPGAFCDLDRNQLESSEWQAAIATAKSHMRRFGGYYSLLRVVLQEPLSHDEPLRVDANKLKDLTPEYDGGGGRFRDVVSGGFVLMEHIPNAASQSRGTDPVMLRSLYRGMGTVQIPVPTRGVLQVVGDLVVHSRRATERQSAVVLDDLRRAPRQGLLGRGFNQVVMVSGRWEQTPSVGPEAVGAQSTEAQPSQLYFLVTNIGGRQLKSPARFDSVEFVDTERHPVAPVVGQAWDVAGYEELVIVRQAEADATSSPQSSGQSLRVVLKGVRANLNP